MKNRSLQILLFSRYDTLGASSRLRTYQYLPALEQQGIEVNRRPLFNNAYLTVLYAGKRKNIAHVVWAYCRRIGDLFKARRFDLIWLEKELLPWLPAWFESNLACQRIPMVVDYDDAIFHRYDLHPRSVWRRFLGKKIDRIMRQARLVTVGNPYLADRARRAGADWVETIPPVIDLARYHPGKARSQSTFTIGWIGSPTTAGYLKLVEGALVAFCQKHEARVVVIGAGHLDLSSKIPLESRSWSETGEADAIAGFDVGIMPLPDTPWARGKCGYKLIQYMGARKPFIASKMSAALDIVQSGETGLLADTEAEWIDCLSRLYHDRQLAAAMGKKGRETVASRYCLQVTAPRLTSLLRQAAGKD